MEFTGAVWVFRGPVSSSRTTDDADHVIAGNSTDGYVGILLESGDVDGDTRDVLLVGSWGSERSLHVVLGAGL